MSAPTAHALLSASSAHRWLNCPPSVRLTENMSEKTSEYAEEGRLAHAIGELHLRKRFTTSIGPKKFKTELKKLQEDPLYKPEMDRHVETYVDYIDQVANAFPSLPYVAVEQRVDFSAIVPEGFGTCDCLIIGGSGMHVIDFKYGQGVEVSAEDNPQMLLYALGALDRYCMLYDIQHVSMTIVQPRKDNITSFSKHADDLRLWGESIKATAQLAAEGGGEYREGDWCRFCKARAQCSVRAQANTALEDFGFLQPHLMAPEEIGDVITRGQRLAKWLSDVQDYALTACLGGQDIPGWKAVEGRSIRQFTDAEAAFNAAKLSGIEDAMLYERKPVTLATLEKVMGKPTFAEVISPYVTVPPGKPALVPAADKRPPITRSTAQEDFKEVTHNGQ